MYYYGVHGREYIEVGLTDGLQAGHCYRLKFRYAYGDSSTIVGDGLGAYFSHDSLVTPNIFFQVIPVQPQMQQPDSVLTIDTAHWLTFVDSFTASGGERYVTIGSFKPDSTVYWQQFRPDPDDNPRCYMFIDAVVLLPCDSPDVVTAVPRTAPPRGKLFPNPAQDRALYRFAGADPATSYRIEVTDLLGRVVWQQPLTNGTAEIDTRAFPNGVYSIVCYSIDQPIERSKLVVRRQ